MKLRMAAVVVALTVGLAACDRDGEAKAAPDKAPSAATTVNAPASADAPVPVPVPAPATLAPVVPAAPGAPAFAALYPGGKLAGEPTTADGAAGPGGLVTFTTEAEPDNVITFYRRRAEAAGLVSLMSMNQGDARAYGAANQASGASVQVVASPDPDAGTSVQLSWSAGQ